MTVIVGSIFLDLSCHLTLEISFYFTVDLYRNKGLPQIRNSTLMKNAARGYLVYV